VVSRLELSVSLALSLRLFLHLAFCLHVCILYAQFLTHRTRRPASSSPSSVTLAQLGSGSHAYASGLQADDLQRLCPCPYTGRGGEGEEEAECSICLSCYAEGVSVCYLRCGHIFHAGCISTWLTVKNACPDCRSEVIPSAV
jgi:hypothetical protein